jgi:hypothetical protein
MPNRYTRSVYKTHFNATLLQKAHIVAQEFSHRPSPQVSEFNSGQLYMGFVMDKVAFGEGFTDYFDFACQYHSTSTASFHILPPMLCKVINLERC